MYLADNSGKFIDAECGFDIYNGQHSIIIESCGGTPRKNPDYIVLVSTILQRLRSAGAKILNVLLESTKTKGLTDAQKQVLTRYSYPIDLANLSLQQIEDLRTGIGSSIAKMLRDPNAKAVGGNSQKRIRIIYDKSLSYSQLSNRDDDGVWELDGVDQVNSLSLTEKEEIRKSRVGQGIFRKGVVALYNRKCAVLGISEEMLLVASHIKPWKDSTNNERLDKFNGLLLSALFDKLFDKGLITFDVNGAIIISSRLSAADSSACGLVPTIRIQIHSQAKQYMDYHRSEVFK